MTRITFAVALSVFVIAATAMAQPVTVRVITAHDPSGLVDKATTDRLAAAEDLKKRLAKNKAVALTDHPDAAVTIDVTGVGWEDRGARTAATAAPLGNGVVAAVPSTALQEFRGHVRITRGTFTTEFDAGLGPLGRSVGENLARRVEDWLKQNAAVLATQ